MPISARIERVTHSPRLHVATAAGFVAYRYKANWIAWTLSNGFSAPLVLHGRMSA